MGDLIGKSISGDLVYYDSKVFEKLLKYNIPFSKKQNLLSYICRINILYMISNAGSGHIGSSFSSIEMMLFFLYKKHINNEKITFFSSKGHDAPAFYNVLISLGKLDFDNIHKLRRIDGLPGHPDISTNYIETNTGSLGMGISKAKGMVLANRLNNYKEKVIVLLGDGELQEGQIWESLLSASNLRMNELIIIIDHNKIQSDTYLKYVNDLGDLKSRFLSYNLNFYRCDGNSIDDLNSTYNKILDDNSDYPSVILADTIKGKGVSFMENTQVDSDLEMYEFHSGAPSKSNYNKAINELTKKIDFLTEKYKINRIPYQIIKYKRKIDNNKYDSLINNYSKSILNIAKQNNNVLALDADLVLDTGLVEFKKTFPDRFVECGIAEQDMVSIAGGLAIRNKIPIVHSFSCFLTSRANEQIYNNSTELSKIIYVGSLAGILPAGPGHSHQSFRDISTMSTIPNLLIYEPSCVDEIELILDWTVNKYKYNSYIRLCSIPHRRLIKLPNKYSIEKGKGYVVEKGSNITLISYGPLMISELIFAKKIIEEKTNFTVKIIAMPWLNFIDTSWINSEVKNMKYILTIDNHSNIGGLGDRIKNVVDKNLVCENIGVEKIPHSGRNDEILNDCKLSSKHISDIVINFFNENK